MLAQLRASLLNRVASYQRAAAPLIRGPGVFPELRRLAEQNAVWLERVIDQHGWPDRELVGEDGAHAAWFLVQHADCRPDFQRRCLELLELAVEAGKADSRDLALLTDRVRVNAAERQLFGTHWHFDGNDWQPMTPISRPDTVDERRRDMGLDSLEDNLARMRGR
jgi:hypothetical protein